MVKTIYPLVAGAVPTSTTASFDPSTDTQVTLESIEWIPVATNHVTLINYPHSITLEYTGITDKTLTGISYVEGDNTVTYPAGSSALRTIDKYDFEAIVENSTTITSYDLLNNRPQINSVTLTGNKTGSDLGLVSIREGTGIELGEDANGVYVWTTT